jgi:hypothetical protein
MSDLTDKFTTLEDEIAGNHTAMMAALSDVNDTLGVINSNLETINSNASLNTQLLLSAISANGQCATCPEGPLLPQAPITDINPIDSEKCQRTQAFLHVIELFCGYADNPSVVSSAFTPAFFTAIIGEVRTATSDSGIPVPGWVDSIVIASDGVNYLVNKAILGGSVSADFASLKSTLQSVIWTAGSPADVKSIFDDTVQGSSAGGAAKALLKGFAFNDLVNYFFDSGSSPVVSGYDGGICSFLPGSCFEMASQAVVVTVPGFGTITRHAIASWPGGLVTQDSDLLGNGYSANQVIVGDLYGYTFEALTGSNVRLVWITGPSTYDGVILDGLGPHALTIHSSQVFVDSVSGAFSIRMCTPAE